MQDVPAPSSQAPNEEKQDKKIAVVSILIVLGMILLYFLLTSSFTAKKHTLNQPWSNQTSEQNSTSPTPIQGVAPLPQINSVALTKNGFSPEKITIKKGTAVKWINNSGTNNASVNSDDYPTNTRFPELNLGKINEGSAVAHIFTNTGTYTYHNEFNPKQKGTVVVE